MGHKGWNVAVLLAIGAIWFAGTTQHEKPVVTSTHIDLVAPLEEEAALHPSAKTVGALAQAYLDARAPGMALAAIERSPSSVKVEPPVEHLYARALLDQGRSRDALAAERRVLERCADPDGLTCSMTLLASATRRADILAELVGLGVEDANAHPEASSLAYVNATRQARLASFPQ